MFYILFLIIILYYLTIIALIYGFTEVNTPDTIDLSPKTNFSILVPFRTEAENLPKLLESFSNLNYPSDLFEVILIDDDSDFRFQISDFRFLNK